jgi:hypothetical protein
MTIKNIKSDLAVSLLWLLANFIGIGLYLLFEYWILSPRPEGEELNGIDEKAFWVMTAFPVLILFLALNAIWLISIFRSGRSGWSWPPLFAWLLMCSAWALAIFGYSNIGIVMLQLFKEMIVGST